MKIQRKHQQKDETVMVFTQDHRQNQTSLAIDWFL